MSDGHIGIQAQVARSGDQGAPTRRTRLSDEEWLALKAWLMGVRADRALDYIASDDRPDEVEPHHYLPTLKTRAIALARQHHRDDLASILRDPQPVGEQSIKRIREAVETLEALPPEVTPTASDALGKWLRPRTANALTRAGILTVTDLHLAAAAPNWQREVTGLGRAGRQDCGALLESLREEGVLVLRRRTNRLSSAWSALRTNTAPIEIDGRRGRFRGPRERCTLDADTDVAAIEAWIRTQASPATREAYRKELIRVVLWATTVRGRALSDLSVEDAREYVTFLADPQPESAWIGPRRPIDAEDWRPFATRLSPKSQRYALQTIRSCIRWLVEQQYVIVNPWAALRPPVGGSTELPLERVPPTRQWKLVRDVALRLEAHGWDEAAATRTRFMLDFLRATGLRVSELCALRLADLHEGEPAEWSIRVNGKGGKVATIDLLPAAKDALITYLRARGHSAVLENNEPSLPVLAQLDETTAAVDRKDAWRVLRRFRKLAAHELASVDVRLAAQIERLSPHTLRHIFGSHALAGGAELKDVSDMLRHASLSTTSGYVHGDSRKRRARLASAVR